MPTARNPDEDPQLALLGANLTVLADDERKGNFTGERLRRLRPEVYQQIIEQWAGGVSMRSLARLYHVSINTVSAVVRAEASTIEAFKKTLSQRSTALFALAQERVAEDLADDETMAKTSPKDKAIVLGILGDRMALADGQPTAIVAQQRIEPEAINDAFFSALPQARPIESCGTGFEGGLSGQKGVALEVEGLPAASDPASGASDPASGASEPVPAASDSGSGSGDLSDTISESNNREAYDQ